MAAIHRPAHIAKSIGLAGTFLRCSYLYMARSKLDSVNDFARQGYLVPVTCLACGNLSDRIRSSSCENCTGVG